jgi:hypothetical protein
VGEVNAGSSSGQSDEQAKNSSSARTRASLGADFVFIRPTEWAEAFSHAYGISTGQASMILGETAASGHATGLTGLSQLWEQASNACARYVAHRDIAVGMDLGYFRWTRHTNGSVSLDGTELASSVGVWRVCRDIDDAIATSANETDFLDEDHEMISDVKVY